MVYSRKRGFLILSLLVFVMGMTACNNKDTTIAAPQGPYSNGFFIVNEGWFQTELSSVNFYPYGADTIQKKVYAKENNGDAPTIQGSNLENACIFDGRLYLVSKANGPIIVADAHTLKKLGSVTMDQSDWRSFVPVSSSLAVVSNTDGIYQVDLNDLTKTPTKVVSDGEVKNMFKAGNNLFASANNGVDIVNLSNYQVTKHYDGPTEGYVQMPNGKVFGALDNLLVAINGTTLDTTQIHLLNPIWSDAWAYHASSIAASTVKNELYYIAGPGYTPNTIYKYIDGQSSSLNQPFITLPAGEWFYETGFGYDKNKDEIVTFSITGYTASDKNFLRFYDASTGALKRTIEYVGVFDPAVLVFY